MSNSLSLALVTSRLALVTSVWLLSSSLWLLVALVAPLAASLAASSSSLGLLSSLPTPRWGIKDLGAGALRNPPETHTVPGGPTIPNFRSAERCEELLEATRADEEPLGGRSHRV